jgi:hypothetical protein
MSGRGRHVKGRSFFIDNEEKEKPNTNYDDVIVNFTTFAEAYEEYKNVLENIFLTIESSNQSCDNAIAFLFRFPNPHKIEGFKLKINKYALQRKQLDISKLMNEISLHFTSLRWLKIQGFNPNYVRMEFPHKYVKTLRVEKVELLTIPDSFFTHDHSDCTIDLKYTNLQILPEEAYLKKREGRLIKLHVEGNHDLKISEAFYNKKPWGLHFREPDIYFEDGVQKNHYDENKVEFEPLPNRNNVDDDDDIVPHDELIMPQTEKVKKERAKNEYSVVDATLTFQNGTSLNTNIRVITKMENNTPKLYIDKPMQDGLSISSQVKRLDPSHEYKVSVMHNNDSKNVKARILVYHDMQSVAHDSIRAFMERYFDSLVAIPNVERKSKVVKLQMRLETWYNESSTID